MFLSKMTAATLEDLNYIVDPSAVRFRAAYSIRVVILYVRRRPMRRATQLQIKTMYTYSTEDHYLAAKRLGGTNRHTIVYNEERKWCT